RRRGCLAQFSCRKPRLLDPLPGGLLFVRPVGSPQFCPVDRQHCGRRSYASWPWQCLYFLPEPQGHGALRLTGASAIAPCASPCGRDCCGMFENGMLDITAPVAASMSAVSSSPENGSICCVINSGRTSGGGGGASSCTCARIRIRVTSSRIETRSRSNSRKASCLYSSIGFFCA